LLALAAITSKRFDFSAPLADRCPKQIPATSPSSTGGEVYFSTRTELEMNTLTLEECGLNPADLPDYVAPEPELALSSEDEPNGKTFPWRQIMGAVKRIVPEVIMPVTGQRRDLMMKKFWRDHGKTVSAFEVLAENVAASDYLMARNGHTGNEGKPYSWGWIFSKNNKGELRADSILFGGYSTEAMAFVLTRGVAKLTKVMPVGSSTAIEVNLAEQLNGSARFRPAGTHANGLPLVIDLKD
jgi:hypothetical protein